MPAISVIIPVLNEETTIENTLQHVKVLDGDKEIIVVDGGSEDKTCQLANNVADRVVTTSSGRGHQMNIGSALDEGEVLFFLHSDSWLEAEALEAIERVMRDSEVIGGCLSLQIDDDSLPLRFISWSSNLRAKYLKIMFGDQGIFVRRSVFEEVGGYPEIELMEDWEFSQQLAKQKGKLKVLPQKIYTSARRWEQDGVWSTIWLMHKIKLLYMLGVEPKKLREIYRDAR